MSLPLLRTPEDWQLVRDVLRIGLDRTAVSDATLLAAPFYGVAEDTIVAAYPLAATESEAGKVRHLTTAAIFLTAANLAAALTLPESEAIGDYRYQMPKEDWEQRASDLRERGLAALAQVTGQTLVSVTLPRLFSAAGGRRGA